MNRDRRVIVLCVGLVCLAALACYWNSKTCTKCNDPNLMEKKMPSAVRSTGHKLMYDSLSITDNFDFDNMTSERIANIYHSVIDAVEVPCRRKLYLGATYGSYDVCDDEEWRLRKPCLVYSIGINNDFSFDDIVGKLYGCEIHLFDPSMKENSHKRSEFVYFHKIGIGKKREKNEQGWELYDLASIRKMLRHEDRTIDILKIDTEEAEWDFLENVLATNALRNVRQLIGEYHILKNADTRENYLRRLKLIVSLRKAGFRSYSAIKLRYTPIAPPRFFKNSGNAPCCYEVAMFNMNFAK